MPTYLVESYVSRANADAALAAGGRVRTTCEQFHREGTHARYVRTTFVPEDETSFHLIEAPSADVAAELCCRANLGQVRVVEANEARAAWPSR